jgi:hypothetical protein
MDIAQPLSVLRRLLEAQLGISLADHEFWLQDQCKVRCLPHSCQYVGLDFVQKFVDIISAGLLLINFKFAFTQQKC